jgi:hypothetical protein
VDIAGGLMLSAAVVDQPGQFRSHFGAMNDSIQEAMFQKELAGLKSVGKFNLAGGLHNARSSETH